jgi:hypothetical protein
MERVRLPAIHFHHIVETETVMATPPLFAAPFSMLRVFHGQRILQVLALDQTYQYDLAHHWQKYESRPLHEQESADCVPQVYWPRVDLKLVASHGGSVVELLKQPSSQYRDQLA